MFVHEIHKRKFKLSSSNEIGLFAQYLKWKQCGTLAILLSRMSGKSIRYQIKNSLKLVI